MYAPPFQTLVDSVCTDLDKHARLSGVGRRYRGPPASDDGDVAAGTFASGGSAVGNGSNGGGDGDANDENLLLSGGSAGGAATAHGLLFGGGAAPKNGPSFAIFAHLSSAKDNISNGSNGASSSPVALPSPVPSPLATTEAAPTEGWESKLGDLAGGQGSMKRTGARVERLKRLAAHGTQKLTQQFATLSQEVRMWVSGVVCVRIRINRRMIQKCYTHWNANGMQKKSC